MTQVAALLRKPTVREAEVTKVKRMRKVVINRCFGGFGLSHEAILRYAQIKRMNLIVEATESSIVPYNYFVDKVSVDTFFWDRDIARDDPVLVQVVEELGKDACSRFADLRIVEIPYEVKWHIAEYDGLEHVAEDHRTWS